MKEEHSPFEQADDTYIVVRDLAAGQPEGAAKTPGAMASDLPASAGVRLPVIKYVCQSWQTYFESRSAPDGCRPMSM
jgi:hypothetical protein